MVELPTTASDGPTTYSGSHEHAIPLWTGTASFFRQWFRWRAKKRCDFLIEIGFVGLSMEKLSMCGAPVHVHTALFAVQYGMAYLPEGFEQLLRRRRIGRLFDRGAEYYIKKPRTFGAQIRG